MKLLEINNIKKTFDDLEVLKDISISVDEGEVVSILGPSGSGKSTLLRCATLLENMDGGTLKYCGETVCEDVDGKSVYVSKSEIKKIKSYFGLVFQNFNLFPHYTVYKNVTDAPIHIQKKDKKEVEKGVLPLLEMMGIGDKADYYPCMLSGGQQQRVAIARALAMNPKMLFFDEPTSALDPELTGEVLNVIKGLKSSDSTMIVVTHEISFARDVADKVIFMADGVIEEEGTPQQVIENPQSLRTQAFLSRFNQYSD